MSTAAGATGLLLCHLLQQRHANVIALTSLSKNHVLKEYTNTLLDYRDLEKLK